MSDEFNAILADCNDAASKADLTEGGGNWKPPPDNYTVVCQPVQVGTKVKNGITCAFIKPGFQIVDGEFEGRVFTDFFWFPQGQTEPDSPALKQLLRLARTITGRDVRNMAEATAAIQTAGDNSDVLAIETFCIEGKDRTYIKYTGRAEE